MAVVPPESWELATPVFGIRYPRPTAPARKLPDAFQHIGVDLESALLADSATAPGLNYRTGTNAERLAAPPIKDQVWVESDTGALYIGTGTAWLPISSPAPVVGAVAGLGGVLWATTQLRRMGTMVVLSGRCTHPTADIAVNFVGGNIPAGFRPINPFRVPSMGMTAGFAVSSNAILLNTNGDIALNVLNVAQVRNFDFSAAWFTS